MNAAHWLRVALGASLVVLASGCAYYHQDYGPHAHYGYGPPYQYGQYYGYGGYYDPYHWHECDYY